MRNIYQFIFGNEMELRERLLRMVLIVGGMMSILGIIEEMVVVGFDYTLIPLVTLFTVIVVDLFVILRFKRVDLASVLLGFVCICVVFPTMFLYSGGIEGGATMWLAVGFIYSFIMFYGRRLHLFLLLCLGINGWLYYYAYMDESRIRRLAGPANVYMDSLFTVLVVGMGIGAMIRFQIILFEQERAVTLFQKEELEKSNNAQNAFFASMSHEIRTPINTIIGLNEMILRSEPKAEVMEYANDIQVASKMLLSLINDVLDVTQMEMKKMEIVSAEYNTKELFGELVDIIQVQTRAKKLQLLVDVDRNLPSVLKGDEKRIKQVVLNILSNAVKYTPSGSITLSATAERGLDDTCVLQISVSDTGVGIKKEDLKHLYDSFKRVDIQKNKKIEGSGLGLAITKQLVDLMHGELSVDSIYTKGSTFTVRLEQGIANETPVGKVDYDRSKKHYTQYDYHQSFEAPEARILIVDDNRMNTMVESKLLTETKMQIDYASSGEECLEMTKEKFYHVILMDYMMTGMNGAETLLELRKQANGLCKESSVIVLTANALEDARWLYEQYRFDGYLEKPVTGKQLEEEILKFLPEEIIEYRNAEQETEVEHTNISMVPGKRNLRKLVITTDSMSDLPENLLNEYGIGMMNLYIKTNHGRFADVKEIDSDSLSRYMSVDSSEAYADSATVEEFEQFFAQALTDADYVLHISMAKGCGKTYEIASAAAQGFDHVQVLDSGQISSGEALITLYAARLAKEGYRLDEVVSMVNKMKPRIHAYYILPTVNIFDQRGFASKFVGNFCKFFHAHPIVSTKNSNLVMRGARLGSLEKTWRNFIRFHLKVKGRPGSGIILVSQVGLSYKQQQYVIDEIKKSAPSNEVIMLKASFSSASNAGIMSIGLGYFTKE